MFLLKISESYCSTKKIVKLFERSRTNRINKGSSNRVLKIKIFLPTMPSGILNCEDYYGKSHFSKKIIFLFFLAREFFRVHFENRRYLMPTQVFHFFAWLKICIIINSNFLQSLRSRIFRRPEISEIFKICPKKFRGPKRIRK